MVVLQAPDKNVHFMTFPCSFDWKLLVDFLRVLLSFPVVVLVLGLIFLNRYQEEIRKKITALKKTTIAGNDAEFSVETAAAIAEENAGEVEEYNILPLMGYVRPAIISAIKVTREQLSQAGKDDADPTELLKHKQERIDFALKMNQDIVKFYGKERALKAIENDIMGIINVYKGAFRNRSIPTQ